MGRVKDHYFEQINADEAELRENHDMYEQMIAEGKAKAEANGNRFCEQCHEEIEGIPDGCRDPWCPMQREDTE